ncbi:hypothetical protein [Microbacterium sp. ASV49]|uniref:MmyB family transcriptional regulator n=1 Tax=Microbacterium candidum TaxID=3041922 RepID=UPI00336A59D8
MRSIGYRWFMDPATRDVYPPEDHAALSRAFTADIRSAYAKHPAHSRAGAIVDALLAESAEFAALWESHEVTSTHSREKGLQHPEVGVMDMHCQLLVDPEQGQTLLVLTATPGTESYERLRLLAVIGTQEISPAQ